jgi:hypothetical protein
MFEPGYCIGSANDQEHKRKWFHAPVLIGFADFGNSKLHYIRLFDASGCIEICK